MTSLADIFLISKLVCDILAVLLLLAFYIEEFLLALLQLSLLIDNLHTACKKHYCCYILEFPIAVMFCFVLYNYLRSTPLLITQITSVACFAFYIMLDYGDHIIRRRQQRQQANNDGGRRVIVEIVDMIDSERERIRELKFERIDTINPVECQICASPVSAYLKPRPPNQCVCTNFLICRDCVLRMDMCPFCRKRF